MGAWHGRAPGVRCSALWIHSLLRFGFLASLVAALVVPAMTASGQTTLPRCFGKSATIVGDQNDTFIKGLRVMT
jgi:hypothetical protein